MENNLFLIDKSNIEAFEDLIPIDFYANKEMFYIGAIDDAGYPTGVLAFRGYKGLIEICFLNVYEEFESDGIENALLEHVLKLGRSENKFYQMFCNYIDNHTYRFLSKAFRESDDFSVIKTDAIYYITPENRKNSPKYQKLKEYKGKTVPFLELDRRAKNYLYVYLRDNDINLFTAADEMFIEPNLSICALDSNNKITTCIMFKVKDDYVNKEIELAFMVIRSKQYSKDMAAVMGEAMRNLEKYYPDAIITINTVNIDSTSMVEKLFESNYTKENICYAYRI